MSNFAAIFFGLFFIFAMTVSGALAACFVPEKSYVKLLPYLNGLSAGIMIAASIWSLVLPAIESAGEFSVFKVGGGIAVGGLFILIVGVVFPEDENASFNRLYLAMTAHNVPEGIAVGFALGSAIALTGSAIAGMSVAIGIGLQNFPEGAALALPARKIYSRKKAFLKGVLSGAVEPIGGVFGVLTVAFVSSLMPYLMAFAAGAMIFVVFSELNVKEEGDGLKLAAGAIIGFIIMMAMDVMLG